MGLHGTNNPIQIIFLWGQGSGRRRTCYVKQKYSCIYKNICCSFHNFLSFSRSSVQDKNIISKSILLILLAAITISKPWPVSIFINFFLFLWWCHLYVPWPNQLICTRTYQDNLYLRSNIFKNWSVVDLQYCVSCRCIIQWFSYLLYTYIYPFSDSFHL